MLGLTMKQILIFSNLNKYPFSSTDTMRYLLRQLVLTNHLFKVTIIIFFFLNKYHGLMAISPGKITSPSRKQPSKPLKYLIMLIQKQL